MKSHYIDPMKSHDIDPIKKIPLDPKIDSHFPIFPTHDLSVFSLFGASGIEVFRDALLEMFAGELGHWI